MSNEKSVPSVSVTYAQNGKSTKPNELGMRVMGSEQEQCKIVR